MSLTPAKQFRFCGVEMSRDSYDEMAAITAYVYKHLSHRLTPLERRAGWPDIPLVSNSDDEKARRLNQYFEERDGHVPDEQILAVYAGNREEFRNRAVNRVLAQFQNEIPTCKKCSSVLHAPSAITCPWCRSQNPTET